MLASLKELFVEWQAAFQVKSSEFGGISSEDLVFDGFYPNYSFQKPRVLFIGWEPRQIEGLNYLDLLYGSYRTGKNIGDRVLANSPFHRRILGISYGLTKGMPPWGSLPEFNDIGDLVSAEGGFSFAFMNLSKISNEADSHVADSSTINAFFKLSTEGVNFYERQVEVLQPDIVISMNLEKLKLEPFSSYTPLYAADGVSWQWLQTGAHRSLWIDAFHFSAWAKDDEQNFYLPICNAICKSGAQW